VIPPHPPRALTVTEKAPVVGVLVADIPFGDARSVLKAKVSVARLYESPILNAAGAKRLTAEHIRPDKLVSLPHTLAMAAVPPIARNRGDTAPLFTELKPPRATRVTEEDPVAGELKMTADEGSTLL
jgi:hypothetical protein